MQSVRGTKDIFGGDIIKYNKIVNVARSISELYIFKEIRTPTIEFSDVFERNLGETSDVVLKEIYKFQDRSGNNISSGPEFTAGIIRAILTNSELRYKFPARLFSFDRYSSLTQISIPSSVTSIGDYAFSGCSSLTQISIPSSVTSIGDYAFRYDRPQKGRYREFNQINFESFGSNSYMCDFDIICMANRILKDLGITNVKLELNSLGCDDSRKRFDDSLRIYFGINQTSSSLHNC